MLVLSHPRSGSTEICRIVELCLYTPGKGVISLGEFFNISDRTMFGNLIDAFHHFRTSTNPKTVKVLGLDKDKIITKKVIFGYEYLSQVDLTFNSSNEVSNWFYNERIRRLELINSFKRFYSIKYFLTLFDNKTDNEFDDRFNKELILSLSEQGKLAFSYRKNLVESVFSGLIKTFYFDKARIENPDNKFVHLMADGHNIHDMPVLQPEPIRIKNYIEDDGEFFEIDGIIKTNLKLLEFYHLFVSKLSINNILCYEDIMKTRKLTLTYQGQTQEYNIDKIPPRIIYQSLDNGTTKELIEKKMNYGDYTREDYFTNSYIVSNIINREIDIIENKSPGFKETLSKLGIIY